MTIGIDFDGDGEYELNVKTSDIRSLVAKILALVTSVSAAIAYCTSKY